MIVSRHIESRGFTVSPEKVQFEATVMWSKCDRRGCKNTFGVELRGLRRPGENSRPSTLTTHYNPTTTVRLRANPLDIRTDPRPDSGTLKVQG